MLKKEMEETLTKCAKLKVRERVLLDQFEELPDKALYPMYYDYIEKPMCLSMIRKKMARNGYKTAQAFVDDMLLMLSNAKYFNRSSSAIYKDANKLLYEFIDVATTIFPNVIIDEDYCSDIDEEKSWEQDAKERVDLAIYEKHEFHRAKLKSRKRNESSIRNKLSPAELAYQTEMQRFVKESSGIKWQSAPSNLALKSHSLKDLADALAKVNEKDAKNKVPCKIPDCKLCAPPPLIPYVRKQDIVTPKWSIISQNGASNEQKRLLPSPSSGRKRKPSSSNSRRKDDKSKEDEDEEQGEEEEEEEEEEDDDEEEGDDEEEEENEEEQEDYDAESEEEDEEEDDDDAEEEEDEDEEVEEDEEDEDEEDEEEEDEEEEDVEEEEEEEERPTKRSRERSKSGGKQVKRVRSRASRSVRASARKRRAR